MKHYKLNNGYKGLIEALLKTGYEVIAPVRKGRLTSFKKITAVDEVLGPDEYINTVRTAKEYVFPVTEAVLGFKFDNKNIELLDTQNEIAQRVIIGLRPCDAASFPIIDAIFNYVYEDNFYNRRRQALTVIGVACTGHDEACFCTSVGVYPDSADGCDLFLIKDASDNMKLLSKSGKGAELIEKLNGAVTVDEGNVEPHPVYERHKAEIRQPLDTSKISQWLEGNFVNDFWDENVSRCLGCATCAFLCPTCHCFDIVDETRYDAGLRRKNWDACQTPVFTQHASGHNPRDKQFKRHRQRLMHKFKYYPERFNKILCTGCGRCARACPVNIDIYALLSQIEGKTE